MAKSSKKPDLDITRLEAIKGTASQMVADFNKLRANQKDCEDAYYMDDNQLSSDLKKTTVSPDPHNKVRGMVRLLENTSPTFNLPAGKNLTQTGINSSNFEKAANAMWMASNLVQEISVEHDMAHAGALYGEINLAIQATRDMAEAAAKSLSENKDKALVPVLEAIASNMEVVQSRTPILFVPLDSYGCYVRKSLVGLEAHYQKVDMTVTDAIAQYGADGLRVLGKRKGYEVVTINIFFERGATFVWVEGENDPILAGANDLDFIPRAYCAPEGSTTYKTKMERAILPFLYPVIKSGIWNRQNLFLSVTAQAAAQLINSQFVMEQGTEGARIDLDLSMLGGVTYVPPGSKLYPMAKEIVNPALVQQYQMYDQIMNESTIYDQTLGQPLAGGPTFSEVALMHQAGRLPLSPIQKGMGTVAANAMDIAFRWLKKLGNAAITTKDGASIEIDASKITTQLNFDALVEVKMPTDNQQGAQSGVAVKQAGLASDEWIRENLMGINQSDEEQRKIWKETMANGMAQQILPAFLQKLAVDMGLAPAQPDMTGGNGTPPTAPTGGNGVMPEAAPTTPIASPGGPNPAGQ